jgi:hypothetical protein
LPCAGIFDEIVVPACDHGNHAVNVKPTIMEQDYLKIRKELNVNGKRLSFYSLKVLQQNGHAIARLPFCIM